MNATFDPPGKPTETKPAELSAAERVEILAEVWQDLRDHGKNPTIEEVCANDPELIPAVRSWLAKVGAMEAKLATKEATGSTIVGSWVNEALFSAPQAADELGRLGGYRILRLIGQGGMGKVYLAEDIKLKRRAAVKVLARGGDSRFLREAQTLAMIDHEHIVSIYQMAEENGTHYIAMPFLLGETLESRLEKQGRLPLDECVRIAKQIALGLAAAHQRGVIHRDIKPSNIWLEEGTDRVKILDFGLAHYANAEKLLSQEGDVVGTPAFMAPEQLQGATVDQRADFFSLGCVLYQMITGVSPFARKDILSTLRALELEPLDAPRVLAPETPTLLSDLVMRLLAKKPADRPNSAAELLDGLQAVEDNATAPRRRRWLGMMAAGVVAALAIFLLSPPQRITDESEVKDAPPVVAAAPAKIDDAPKVKPVAIAPVGPAAAERADFMISVALPKSKEDDLGVRRLTEGRPLQFEIEVEETSHIGIWILGDHGTVKQLFPNKHDPNNLFEAGKKHTIPSSDTYSILLPPSKGPEVLCVIASTNPWTWDPQNSQGTFRLFRDRKDFEHTLRTVILGMNENGPPRSSQVSMPVWVAPKITTLAP